MRVWILSVLLLVFYRLAEIEAEIRDDSNTSLKHTEKKCDCGKDSKGCTYDDKGKKICICKPKYGQKGDQCVACNCLYAIGCHFDDKNNKFCECVSNKFKQNGGGCEYCDCGRDSTNCYFENGAKKCDCSPNYIMDGYGECRECECGVNSTWCEYKGYKKICTCDKGYSQQDDEPYRCYKCDCGPHSTSCSVTFDGYSRCTCKEGYEAKHLNWEEYEYCRLPEPPYDYMPLVYICVALVFIITIVTVGYAVYRKRNR